MGTEGVIERQGDEWYGRGEELSYQELFSVMSSICDEVGNEASINCLSPEVFISDNTKLKSCCISIKLEYVLCYAYINICMYISICYSLLCKTLPEKNCSGGLAGIITECMCRASGIRSGL